MTTSDLVARLTARANLTYSYPIEDILLFRGAADEIERLNTENARLREALFNSNHFLKHLCEALNIDPAETFIRLKNADTHELLNEKSIAAVFEQTRAALAEQEKK